MDDYIGSIMLWGPNWAPRNWAFCQGQLLQIAQFTSLFSIIGTNYGGDGIRTFGLPDFRGRVPVSAGYGPGLTPYYLGMWGGRESVALQTANAAVHAHDAIGVQACSPAPGDSNNPAGKVLATSTHSGSPVNIFKAGAAPADMGASTAEVTVQAAGSGSPMTTVQPCQAVQYVICLQGLYPSRS